MASDLCFLPFVWEALKVHGVKFDAENWWKKAGVLNFLIHA